MFHRDIMYSIMQERTRELRARAKAERDAGVARRARAFWAEQALRPVSRLPRRRAAVRPRSAAQPRCTAEAR